MGYIFIFVDGFYVCEVGIVGYYPRRKKVTCITILIIRNFSDGFRNISGVRLVIFGSYYTIEANCFGHGPKATGDRKTRAFVTYNTRSQETSISWKLLITWQIEIIFIVYFVKQLAGAVEYFCVQ